MTTKQPKITDVEFLKRLKTAINRTWEYVSADADLYTSKRERIELTLDRVTMWGELSPEDKKIFLAMNYKQLVEITNTVL